MCKDQRGWVRRILDEAWETASAKFIEIRAEKERKHAEWLDRTDENVKRWQGSIEKCEEAISRLESQISDLEYKESTARTDEFASMRIPMIRTTDSEGKRPLIPIEGGHLFRVNPATLPNRKQC